MLTLLLCIPLAEINAINRERGHSQREAAEELAATYAGPQTVVGPLLLVPYVERWMEPLRDAKGKVIGQEPRSKEMTHAGAAQDLVRTIARCREPADAQGLRRIDGRVISLSVM